MNNHDFIKIINEEINNFDFLGNDEFLKEQEVTDLLQNEDLQKQFICDALLRRKDKVKILQIMDSHVTGDWDDNNFEDARKIELAYYLKMEYTYDAEKEPIQFELNFDSHGIDINIHSSYNDGNWGATMADAIEPSGEAWYNGFKWEDIDVSIYSLDGDEINFIAFEKAPPKIQTLFIREFTQNFIENETLEIETPEMKDNVHNTPYC